MKNKNESEKIAKFPLKWPIETACARATGE
jgi:hypothetical protein